MTHCAQLNNNYLPPAGASQAGGGGGTGLQAPRPGSTLGGANVPISPGRPQAPSPLRPPTQAAAAAPSGPPIEIISYESVNNGDGSYKWR
jgi:loricrin